MIREAKESKDDLTVVWLDLANVYGSITHALIYAALNHYHIFAHQGNDHFGDIQIRFKTPQITTQWQNLEEGNHNWPYNLPHPLHRGNEPPYNSCWERSQSSYD